MQGKSVLTFEVGGVHFNAAYDPRMTQAKHGPLITRHLQDPTLVYL